MEKKQQRKSLLTADAKLLLGKIRVVNCYSTGLFLFTVSALILVLVGS